MKKMVVLLALFGMIVSGCGTTTTHPTTQPAQNTSSQAKSHVAAPATPGHVIVEPTVGVAPYVQAINGAHRVVDVNSYLLTDRSIISALRKAADRGVSVHVIVAGDPYRDASAVRTEKQAFAGSRVQVHIAPARFERPYTFDHAKYLVTDPPKGEALLGSSNLTYSGLGGGNREYDWVTNSPAAVQSLAEVFQADWTNHQAGSVPRKTVVLSPGSEPQLVSLLSSAQRSIDIETEEFSRVSAIMTVLRTKLQQHVQVRIVVPASISKYDLQQLDALKTDGAQVKTIKRPYIHAKLIVVDQKRAFIGSQNISDSSLSKNREVGIMLMGSSVQVLAKQFEADFNKR